MTIKELTRLEINEAITLAWSVFYEYVAPDYTKEGVEEFYKSIHDESWLVQLRIHGAFSRSRLLGIIATRSDGSHIALFFVDGKYQRQGVGKLLFKTVIDNSDVNRITVNSSPYAIPVYRKLGFVDIDIEQEVNGLRFTPMELKKKGGEAL